MRAPVQSEHTILIPLHDVIAHGQHGLVASVYLVPLYHTRQVRAEVLHVFRYIQVYVLVWEPRAVVVNVLYVHCQV